MDSPGDRSFERHVFQSIAGRHFLFRQGRQFVFDIAQLSRNFRPQSLINLQVLKLDFCDLSTASRDGLQSIAPFTMQPRGAAIEVVNPVYGDDPHVVQFADDDKLFTDQLDFSCLGLLLHIQARNLLVQLLNLLTQAGLLAVTRDTPILE